MLFGARFCLPASCVLCVCVFPASHGQVPLLRVAHRTPLPRAIHLWTLRRCALEHDNRREANINLLAKRRIPRSGSLGMKGWRPVWIIIWEASLQQNPWLRERRHVPSQYVWGKHRLLDGSGVGLTSLRIEAGILRPGGPA